MMTPQENQLLQDFLEQLTAVRGIVKDPEADASIARATAGQPDASYLLVQRALLLDQALQSAKAEIAQLQDQLRRSGPAVTSTSFLGSTDNAWGRRSATEATPAAGAAHAPVMNPAMAQATAGAGQSSPQRPGLAGGGGGFLQQAAATAAGVAGGAFLFSGIQNMMGHHGGGLFGSGSPAGSTPENTAGNLHGESPANVGHRAAVDSRANDSGNETNVQSSDDDAVDPSLDDMPLDGLSAEDSFSSDDFA